MAEVVLSIPRLGVKQGGWERNKEVYVLSFTSDENNQGHMVPDLIAAQNETLPDVWPEVGDVALSKFVHVAASNTFQRIRPDQPVSLSGSGIILYPNLNPGGMLANHFVVLEDDQGQRRVSDLLNRLISDEKVSGVVEKMQKGVSRSLVGGLFRALISQLPQALPKKDDFLFSHNHSGFDFDDYGLPPGETVGHDFELENDRVFCTLRVRVNRS